MSPRMRHHLTIDLESWVHRFEPAVAKRVAPERLMAGARCATRHRAPGSAARMARDAGYIERATLLILERLRHHRQRTTFFVVAEIYDWYPRLIEAIAEEGHEIAFHGYDHRTLDEPARLAEALEHAAHFLQRFHPVGFRAPRMWMSEPDCLLLAERGFRYDSSIYAAPRRIDGRFPLLELPVSTLSLGSAPVAASMPRDFVQTLRAGELPIGSGLFVGLLGDASLHWIHWFAQRGRSAHLFLHPWQIVPPPFDWRELFDGPPLWASWPYLVNRRATFERLLASISFEPLRSVIGSGDRSAA